MLRVRSLPAFVAAAVLFAMVACAGWTWTAGARLGGGGAGAPVTPVAPVAQERVELAEGHVDAFNVTAEGGGLHLNLKEDVTGSHVTHDPTDVLLRVKDEVYSEEVADVPEIGEPAYFLPQTPDPKKNTLWPGWDTLGVAAGGFEAVDIEFEEIDGPGEVHLFQTKDFGGVRPVAESTLLESGSVIHQGFPSHTHANWVFTEPGVYRMTVRATVGDVSSESATYTWLVGDATEAPADPRDEGGKLTMAVVNGQQVEPAEESCLRLAPDADTSDTEVSRFRLPDNPALRFLGRPGDVLWIGPQRMPFLQNFRPLWAGIGAFDPAHEYEVPTDFENGEVTFELTDFSGPEGGQVHNFFGRFGDAEMERMFGAPEGAKSFTAPVGSHGHYNWTFSKPGIYSFTWKVRGRHTDGTEGVSEEVTQTWLVGSDEQVGLPEGTTTDLNEITEPVEPESTDPSDNGTPGETGAPGKSEEPSAPRNRRRPASPPSRRSRGSRAPRNRARVTREAVTRPPAGATPSAPGTWTSRSARRAAGPPSISRTRRT
ncbi:choice-of-anchor M domain-containing protein [Corynebacterium sp. MSK006]|uniref:choice-of-anchor M domain-containing protein n=1 Tax=Corynebacterium sp. MSK006 TaxID=3050187 RepID=UPI00254D0084|nr:choice-of-anchor M domain-containing protein [Corynebacterium sp. MSK006]MDK8895302.1 choice-of-anchor M domain-containing protein [Corynebacterium sp. MSK006]